MAWRTRSLVLAVAAALAVLAVVVPGAGPKPVAAPARVADRVAQRAPAIVREPVTAVRTPAGDIAVVERFVVDEGAETRAREQQRVAPPPAVEPIGPTTAVVHTEHAGDERDAQAASTSGSCPKASTCDVYILQAARWKTDTTGKLTLKWRFNDEGRRKLRAEAGLLESALKTGMAEWERWNSNVDFVYSGTTTALFGAKGTSGTCDDGTNVIGWSRMEPGTIAQVITCHDRTGKRIVDADLALNVTFHWEDIQGEPESRHSYDIRSIVTHELGHFVGALGDLYSRDALYQTMMGNAKYGEVRKRTLALGDIIGLQRAYPCGEGDTCPRKGIVND